MERGPSGFSRPRLERKIVCIDEVKQKLRYHARKIAECVTSGQAGHLETRICDISSGGEVGIIFKLVHMAAF